jgi:hypothetical protein
MASPHRWRFALQLSEAQRRPPASKLPGVWGHRNRFGYQMRCGSWGYCSEFELVEWLPAWLLFPVVPLHRPEPSGRKRRRAGPIPLAEHFDQSLIVPPAWRIPLGKFTFLLLSVRNTLRKRACRSPTNIPGLL